MTKAPDFEKCAERLYANGMRFISGKYFDYNKKEIVSLPKYIYTYGTQKLLSDRDKEKLMELFRYRQMISEPIDGLWPSIEWPEKEGELPFPLDEKQLVIINRMLYHPFDNKDRNIFITTGVGGSGKSTFLNIVRQLFKNDCGNANMTDLSNDFTFAEAVKHRLICADEIGSKTLDCEHLKQLASKEKIQVNPKFVTPYEIQSQSALFWCCNNIPHIDISDSGTLRRIVFYERNTPIKNPKPELAQREYTNDELAIIATAAKKYDCDDWFERYFEQETRKWLMLSNSVWRYWTMSYFDYTEKCRSGGKKPFSEDNWEEIHRLFERWLSECSNKEELNTHHQLSL